MHCSYHQACRPVYTYCHRTFCQEHLPLRTGDGRDHASSILIQAPTAAEIVVIDMGLEIIRQSQQTQLCQALKKLKEEQSRILRCFQGLAQQTADELKAVNLRSKEACQALQTIKTQGIPAASADKVTECFLRLRMVPEHTWEDTFTLDLAELGFVSAFVTAGFYRRSQAKLEAGKITDNLVKDLALRLKTQEQMDVGDLEVARTEALLARALAKQNKLKKAEIYARRALFHAENNLSIEAQAFLVLGCVSHRMNHRTNAIEYFSQALAAQLRQSRFDALTVAIYTSLGIAYEHAGDYNTAERQFEAARYALLTGNPVDVSQTALLVSHCARMKLHLKKFKKAETLYLDALQVLESEGPSSDLKLVYMGLKSVYAQKQDIDQELEYTEKLWTLVDQQDVPANEQCSILSSLIKLHKAKKNIRKVKECKAKLMSLQIIPDLEYPFLV